MALRSDDVRRSVATTGGGRAARLAFRALVGLAWGLTSAWAVAPAVSRLGPPWQGVAWIPDWAWVSVIAVPGSLAVVISRRARGRRAAGALAALLALVPPTLGMLHRDLGWVTALEGPVVRIAFLQAQDPDDAPARDMVGELEGLGADLVVVVNPGWIPTNWRRQEAAGDDPAWSVQWRRPVMTASPHGPSVLRTLVARDGIIAVRITPPAAIVEALGIESILAVDLPSDPSLNRDSIAADLLAGLAAAGHDGLDDFDLVVGDFNMTPRTPAFGRLSAGLDDLVTTDGDGWTATWPRRLPMLRIDQMVAQPRLAEGRSCRIRTFDPGHGQHRGFTLDVEEIAVGD